MKLKIFTYLIIFFLLHSTVKSQNSIIGVVQDANNKTNIEGAIVYIAEIKMKTTTNKSGRFVLRNIPKGSYSLKVNATGYQTINKKIELSSDTLFNFFLEQNFTALNEVVVTAVSRSTQVKLSPVIIKPVDIAQLNQNSYTNLIDALKNIPGVNQITTGSGISKPTIRGLGYNRVITLYNGIKQEGQQWGDEHGIEIDEYSVSRVEIVKGPGSLMYGSDAIAGVLNFITPKIKSLKHTTTQLISNYQSNNNLIGNSFSHAGSTKSFHWLGRVSNKLAGNYQNKTDGKVYNSGFKELNANIFLGIHKNWGYTHFNISTYNIELNIVDGDRDSLGNFVYDFVNNNRTITKKTVTSNILKGYKRGIPYQIVNHFRVMSNSFFQLSKGSINMDIGYQNNRRKEFGNALYENRKDQFFDLHTINYSARFNFLENNNWATSIGINGMQQNNFNKGLEFLIPQYNLFDIGGYIITQKLFNKLTLAGGLRFDLRKLATKKLVLDSLKRPVNYEDNTTIIKFNNLNKVFNNFSGSVGISYQINKNETLKLNISRGFRAPSMAELTSNGQHEGTFRYEFGNAQLQSEVSHQIDIAYFNNTSEFTLECTPFINFVSNYIYTYKLVSVFGGDSIYNPIKPFPSIKYTQGNAVLFGGELYFNLRPTAIKWLNIESAFSYVRATQNKQPDSTKFLPLIPAPKLNCNVKLQCKQVGKLFTNAYFKIGFDYFLEQNKYYKANFSETLTPAYWLLNFGFGGNLKLFNKKDMLSLFFSADNFLDVSYQSHLNRLKYAPQNKLTGKNGVFNMGRNFCIKTIFNF
ncbi:MAG TPA: TonB-dependent receptor [Chitinophagaceae bacterium]|nr:TonB-dependent receptor [Chitinophagaceae bacterium]